MKKHNVENILYSLGIKIDSKQLLKMKQAFALVKESHSMVLASNPFLAEQMKNKYDCLIKQGFTKEQALKLIK